MANLLARERKFAVIPDYPERLERFEASLAQSLGGDSSTFFHATDRIVVCHWLQELGHELELDRETVQRAINAFDRYMQYHVRQLESRALTSWTALAESPIPIRPATSHDGHFAVPSHDGHFAVPSESRATPVSSKAPNSGAGAGAGASAGGVARVYRPVRSDIQMFAAAAAGLVFKHETDMGDACVDFQDMSFYTDDSVSVKQLQGMESRAWCALDFRLNAVTIDEALALVMQMLIFHLTTKLYLTNLSVTRKLTGDPKDPTKKALAEAIRVETSLRFAQIMDLVVLDQAHLAFRPSLIAVCIIRALFPAWSELTRRISGYSLTDHTNTTCLAWILALTRSLPPVSESNAPTAPSDAERKAWTQAHPGDVKEMFARVATARAIGTPAITTASVIATPQPIGL